MFLWGINFLKAVKANVCTKSNKNSPTGSSFEKKNSSKNKVVSMILWHKGHLGLKLLLQLGISEQTHHFQHLDQNSLKIHKFFFKKSHSNPIFSAPTSQPSRQKDTNLLFTTFSLLLEVCYIQTRPPPYRYFNIMMSIFLILMIAHCQTAVNSHKKRYDMDQQK